MKRFIYYLEINPVCNLSCPSCPQGQNKAMLHDAMMPHGTFLDLLMKIVDDGQCRELRLFNWGEPLLHPEVAGYVATAKRHGIKVGLSSNLNLRHNAVETIRDVLSAQPDWLLISTSGWSKEQYETTHHGGDLDVLECNMRYVARYRTRKTRVTVFFHRYRGNERDEAALREYAKNFGFAFRSCEAILMPLELVLRRWEKRTPEALPIEDRLLTPLERAREQCTPHASLRCWLAGSNIVIDSQGRVLTCCALADRRLALLGHHYMNASIAEIQEAKRTSDVCRWCTQRAGHVYALQAHHRRERVAVRVMNLLGR